MDRVVLKERRLHQSNTNLPTTICKTGENVCLQGHHEGCLFELYLSWPSSLHHFHWRPAEWRWFQSESWAPQPTPPSCPIPPSRGFLQGAEKLKTHGFSCLGIKLIQLCIAFSPFSILFINFELIKRNLKYQIFIYTINLAQVQLHNDHNYAKQLSGFPAPVFSRALDWVLL